MAAYKKPHKLKKCVQQKSHTPKNAWLPLLPHKLNLQTYTNKAKHTKTEHTFLPKIKMYTLPTTSISLYSICVVYYECITLLEFLQLFIIKLFLVPIAVQTQHIQNIKICQENNSLDTSFYCPLEYGS